MGKAGEGTAVGFGHQRVTLGEALYMHFVDNRPLPRGFRFARASPSEGRVNYAALLHQGGAITLIKRLVLVSVIETVAKKLRSPTRCAD